MGEKTMEKEDTARTLRCAKGSLRELSRAFEFVMAKGSAPSPYVSERNARRRAKQTAPAARFTHDALSHGERER